MSMEEANSRCASFDPNAKVAGMDSAGEEVSIYQLSHMNVREVAFNREQNQ